MKDGLDQAVRYFSSLVSGPDIRQVREIQAHISALNCGEITLNEFKELMEDSTDLKRISGISGDLKNEIEIQKALNNIRVLAGLVPLPF